MRKKDTFIYSIINKLFMYLIIKMKVEQSDIKRLEELKKITNSKTNAKAIRELLRNGRLF